MRHQAEWKKAGQAEEKTRSYSKRRELAAFFNVGPEWELRICIRIRSLGGNFRESDNMPDGQRAYWARRSTRLGSLRRIST